ncbi:hypothetical protein ACFW08_05605 [Streptomyces sp. NPDC058960]|uniref:hypothetical protein n=1 Tax=Streptomyces sp. NPDC058960 TaxID=3346679 RepID=UPI0036803275
MTLKFNVDDVVHVRDDVTGFRWNTVGIVTAIFHGDPYPYGVEMPGHIVYARFAADEVTDALAETGRPSRLPFRLAVVGASVATVAALGMSLAPDAQAPASPTLSDVVTAPVITPTPVTPQPYRPEPRPTPHTTREGVRETLTPRPSTHIATPRTTPTRRHPIAKPPADVRISFYRVCESRPQPCIDAGALTMYAGNILAGHNYMGYQWLSRVPVDRTVRVISGPLAGTYRVYGHLRISRQGGSIPVFPGSPALVLQTCEGSGTGFSLLHRI